MKSVFIWLIYFSLFYRSMRVRTAYWCNLRYFTALVSFFSSSTLHSVSSLSCTGAVNLKTLTSVQKLVKQTRTSFFNPDKFSEVGNVNKQSDKGHLEASK